MKINECGIAVHLNDIMFSSLEHRDNFYVNLPSNVPSLAQNNHPAHFKVALLERI